jgi:hypothetical protein
MKVVAASAIIILRNMASPPVFRNHGRVSALEDIAPACAKMLPFPDVSLNSAVLPITFPSVARSSVT